MKKCRLLFITVFALIVFILPLEYKSVYAMPFYGLNPKSIVVRSEFFTSYYGSTDERKQNIALAVKFLDKTIVDVGGEFSFNFTVGERTEKRGFKTAKIILNGKFVEGIGGGVCQVSSTLYNAVILAGLKITEYHPHSLAVSYIAPSFDAMVNSGAADLRFYNNTDNPIIIRANADGNKLKIKILGEPMNYSLKRESVVKETIPIPEIEYVYDDKGEYPDLLKGEKMPLSYGKEGLKSEGYLIKYINGKEVSKIKLRSDVYKAVGGVTVIGTA